MVTAVPEWKVPNGFLPRSSSRQVLTQIGLLKSHHNKSSVVNCNDTHDIRFRDLALWVLLRWWFFCQKIAGASPIPVLTLTLCLISNSTQNLTATGSRLCILRFNHLCCAVFGRYIMVHSLWRICLWSKDVGLLYSFLGLQMILFSSAISVYSLMDLNFKVLCIYPEKKCHFGGNLLFIPGLPPDEQTERPLSFCLHWVSCLGRVCLQLLSSLSNSKNMTYIVSHMSIINNKRLLMLKI